MFSREKRKTTTSQEEENSESIRRGKEVLRKGVKESIPTRKEGTVGHTVVMEYGVIWGIVSRVRSG